MDDNEQRASIEFRTDKVCKAEQTLTGRLRLAEHVDLQSCAFCNSALPCLFNSDGIQKSAGVYG